MFDLPAGIGRSILHIFHEGIALFLRLPDNLSVILRNLCFRNSLFRDNFFREFYHSGIKSLPGIALAACLISIAVMRVLPYSAEVLGIDTDFLYGKVFQLLIHEVAPLSAGILVAIRAAVYITMRLAQMKIGGEVRTLEILGINPSAYLGSMCIFAGILTVPFVSLYFILVSLITASFILLVTKTELTVIQFVYCLVPYFSWKNVGIFLLKTMLSGWFIYCLSVYSGLSVKKDKQMIVSRTIDSILFSVIAVILINILAAIFW